MSGTLLDMRIRIASELKRSDLTSEITDAINDAIAEYQKVRLRFNETVPAVAQTFPSKAANPVYTSADNPNIGSNYYIDYLNVLIGTTWAKMERRTPEEIRLLLMSGQQAGPPSDFAYEGNQIIIYPAAPNTSYTFLIGGHFMYAAPASDNETGNYWMTDAERLIRSRAKYELAVHVTGNDKMAAAMSPYSSAPGAAYWALVSLKGEANKVQSTGRVRAMRF